MQSMLQDTYPTHNRDVGRRSSGRPTPSERILPPPDANPFTNI